MSDLSNFFYQPITSTRHTCSTGWGVTKTYVFKLKVLEFSDLWEGGATYLYVVFYI